MTSRVRVRRPDPPEGYPEDPFAGCPTLPVPSSMLVAMGIDASLTDTGIGVLSEAKLWSKSYAPKFMRGAERLAWFRDQLLALIRQVGPDLIALEGYSFGSRNGREAMGELGGIVKLVALDTAVPVMIVTPNDLKLFITGKGNGEKSTVSKELYKRYGVDLNNNNQVDAAVLALMALAKLDGSFALTEFQKRALTKALD